MEIKDGEVSWDRREVSCRRDFRGQCARPRAVLQKLKLRGECTWAVAERCRRQEASSHSVLLARCNGESDSAFWNPTDD